MTVPEQEESGGQLRDKMVAWRKIAVDSVVGQFKHVQPSDLDGVDPDQVLSKAQEAEAARKAQADGLLRSALGDLIKPEEDLETALSRLGAPKDAPVQDNAAARIASLGSLGGTPVRPKVEVVPDDALGKIRAGLAAQGK
ncbi:MAG: hypothetical protein H0U13_12095 [Gemmatimonadaceae bacterium]|nr:hypothetical protein [Gemmatimonadaceae bacterium]